MRNRLIYAALGIVGVLLIGLAIASATVWRADSVLHASATADQAIVVTDPGVLEMAGDPVTVTATVPTGDRVVLAIGRDTDVDGWVGTADHQRVAGLSGWHTLAIAAPATPTARASGTPAPTATASATGTPTDQPSPTTSAAAAPAGATTAAPAGTATTAPVPDATASDMWVATAHGTGSASLTWQAQPGRWSLLVVGSTAAGAGVPPTLALEWPRSVTTPYLAPGVVVGGLLVLAALFLFWRDLRRRHGAAWTPVATGAIPVVTAGQGAMTRRQLREMAELARTGQLPTIAPPPGPTASVPVTAPPAAGPAPRVPGPVGTPAAHDEPAASGAAIPAPSGAPLPAPSGAAATVSGRGSGRGVTPTRDASSGAVGTGPGSRPMAPTTGNGDTARPSANVATPATTSGGDAARPSEHVVTPPAAAEARKGRWRRAADPVPQQAAEPLSTPASSSASSASWAPQEVSSSIPPVPAEVSPVKPPAPGGRRARRQAAEAAAATAGAAAPVGTVEPASSGSGGEAPPAPEPAAAAPAAHHPASSRPAWMPAPPAAPAPAATPVPAPVPAVSLSAPAPADPRPTPAPADARPAPAPGAWSSPVAPAPAAERASASAPAPAHGPGAQPAWLSRVAARWEQEDAAAEAAEAAAAREPDRSQPSPSSSATAAPQPSETAEPPAGRTPPHGDPQQPAEASRADAWRRAWGLPPLETEENDR